MHTVAEVAQALNLSYNSVKSYIRRGTIKAEKFGGWQWAISDEEFNRLKAKYLGGGESVNANNNRPDGSII